MRKLLIFTVFGVLVFSLAAFFSVKKKNTAENVIAEIYDAAKDEADSPEKFAEYFHNITTRIGGKEPGYKMNYKKAEFEKAVQRLKALNLDTKADIGWMQRGPANVGGRTRALIVDPDDVTHNTWFAGAATGGVWKTTDAGATWTNLSANYTTLAVSDMVMAPSNTNIIYVGTGESFTGGFSVKGDGIWKTTDKGSSWTQLASTASNNDFGYVNRLIVNPTDENIVLAATETGIFKSADGGINWTQVYSSSTGVEDLTYDPSNFNIMFAGENSRGILRSSDAGNTWALSGNGMGAGTRFEVAVSNADNNYVFVSTEVSSSVSQVYVSTDKGLTWKRFDDDQNFLGGQGWYDNAVTPHPYTADEVFVGGVDIWKLKFNGTETSVNEVLRAFTENTTFLSFINFGGAFLDGGMSIEEGTSLTASDWSSVEIRFGPGITQKAHRFTVPAGSTSGVPSTDYTYQDYIDVPFQVWDTDNNVQLMVSFRDQEGDGEFNLYERTGDAYGELGREYIFVNAVPYDSVNPDANIATAGGHLYKALYMIWPTLTPGELWDPANLPASKIVIEYGTITLISGEKTSIADSYGSYGGPNGYNQGAGYGTTSIPGLHPDHHNITLVPLGAPDFIWIDGNDGGIGVSYDNGVTLDQIPTNYITTQFYGVAKNPEANEYIGGMQDNGTWQSPEGTDASSSSNYLFRLGGDGFECLWNAEDPTLILGSLYNNRIYRSANKGLSWGAVSGIASNDGPFITRLSVSKERPYDVFAVGGSGVYKSVNFGQMFNMKTISTNWAVNGTVSSSHNVEVSLANGKVVWAGGGMAANYGLQMQVSTDYGNTFTAVPDYDIVTMNAYISGIATHPVDENTAYVLFSLSDKPKVLRTTDLGQTWTDISGFGTGNESTTGFPDVVTHCLLVMPYNTDVIWVGTDIGLVESIDNGATWHLANNGLPPVSVYDMYISGDQVVVATHGRGIWTVDIPEIFNAPYITSFTKGLGDKLEIETDFKVNYDSVQVYINNTLDTTIVSPATGAQILSIDYSLYVGGYAAKITGYVGTQPYYSNTINLTISTLSDIETISDEYYKLKLYPNPASDFVNFTLEKSIDNYKVSVYSITGQEVYSEIKRNNEINSINISDLSEGSYVLFIITEDKKYSQILQIRK